jgi:hypothetical protein
MIAFEIRLNGKALCTAGVGDRGVVSAIATWVKRVARNPKSGRPLKRFEEELAFDVGGLIPGRKGASVHLDWVKRRLRIGDEIRVQVVETRRVTRPRTRRHWSR